MIEAVIRNGIQYPVAGESDDKVCVVVDYPQALPPEERKSVFVWWFKKNVELIFGPDDDEKMKEGHLDSPEELGRNSQ